MVRVIGASVALRRCVKRTAWLIYITAGEIGKHAIEQQDRLSECTLHDAVDGADDRCRAAESKHINGARAAQQRL